MTGKDARFIRQLVHSFDRTERLVLMLHYVEALSTDEIALVLDLPVHHIGDLLEQIQQRTKTALAEFRIAS